MYIDITPFKFENSRTELIFKLAFDYISHGMAPYVIETLLESKILLFASKEDISEYEILELELLKKIMLLYQGCEYGQFLMYQNQLYSINVQSINELKFSKFDIS